VDACPAGTHLPTIRELAKKGQALGAKGILEVNQVTPDSVLFDGYYKISAINPNGEKDEFYYSNAGYKRPDGDLGNNNFWSSSVDSNYSDRAFVFDGFGGTANGTGVRDYNFDDTAVLCFAGR